MSNYYSERHRTSSQHRYTHTHIHTHTHKAIREINKMQVHVQAVHAGCSTQTHEEPPGLDLIQHGTTNLAPIKVYGSSPPHKYSILCGTHRNTGAGSIGKKWQVSFHEMCCLYVRNHHRWKKQRSQTNPGLNWTSRDDYNPKHKNYKCQMAHGEQDQYERGGGISALSTELLWIFLY